MNQHTSVSNTETENSKATVSKGTESDGIQLLSFLLDNDVYGVDISLIQEVIEYRRVTTVPRTPAFMLGVINLRGKVVPVVDLRKHFDMHVSEITVNTCIVIVDVMVENELTSLGILADAVKEVIELSLEDVSAPPRIGSRIDTRYISGMGKYEDDFIIILNLSRIFSESEIESVFHTISDVENDETNSNN